MEAVRVDSYCFCLLFFCLLAFGNDSALRRTFHKVQGRREPGTWPETNQPQKLRALRRCFVESQQREYFEGGCPAARRSREQSRCTHAALHGVRASGRRRAGAALRGRPGRQRGARNAAPLRQVAAQGGPPAHARSCDGPAAVAPAPRAPWAAVGVPESAFAWRRLLAPRSAPGRCRLWSRVPRSPTSSCCSCRSRRFGRGRPRGEPPPAGP